jgi:hypothetical protein
MRVVRHAKKAQSLLHLLSLESRRREKVVTWFQSCFTAVFICVMHFYVELSPSRSLSSTQVAAIKTAKANKQLAWQQSLYWQSNDRSSSEDRSGRETNRFETCVRGTNNWSFSTKIFFVIGFPACGSELHVYEFFIYFHFSVLFFSQLTHFLSFASFQTRAKCAFTTMSMPVFVTRGVPFEHCWNLKRTTRNDFLMGFFKTATFVRIK